MFRESRLTLLYTECFTMLNNIPYELSDYALEKYFREVGERQGWLPHKDDKRVFIAVSGGGDSIALLWLFKKFYKGDVWTIHVNHGIRGQESDEDENFVKNFAGQAIVINVNVPEERLKGESIEAAARRIRHEKIIESAKSFEIDTVFLGHNRDDLAETVLFNILRGTGIRGGVGITESSEINGIKFYRPLLGLRREFLRDILRVRNIQWREDSTNSDSKYTRNYIRLKLLPDIETHINSSAIEHLANFGEEMRSIREREDSISTELFNACLVNRDNDANTILNRKILRTLDEDKIALIIREAGRKLNLKTLSRERCAELATLISAPKNFIFQWCGGFTVNGISNRIIFEDKRGEENNNASK